MEIFFHLIYSSVSYFNMVLDFLSHTNRLSYINILNFMVLRTCTRHYGYLFLECIFTKIVQPFGNMYLKVKESPKIFAILW